MAFTKVEGMFNAAENLDSLQVLVYCSFEVML